MNTDKAQNRRNFLKKSMTGIIGAAIVPATLKNSSFTPTAEKKKQKIIYRTLGNIPEKIWPTPRMVQDQ